MKKRSKNEVQEFLSGWKKQITREHVCIWSDEWMKKAESQLLQEKLVKESRDSNND